MMILYFLRFVKTPINNSSLSSCDPALWMLCELLLSVSTLHGKWVNTGREDPLWSKTKRWDVINSRAHLLAVSPLTDSSDLCSRTNMGFNQTHNPRSELKQDLSLNQMIIVTSCHVWAPNSRGVTIHVKQWALCLTFSVFVICFLILVPHWTKGSH